jgi:putative endonuclease
MKKSADHAGGRIVQATSSIHSPAVTLPRDVIALVRSRRGQVADQRGRTAEAAAQSALERDGWNILARRLRTAAGEIDMVAEKEGLLAIVEVKARPRLADAAASLSDRQQARLISATEIILAKNPQWGIEGVRFDLLLVDADGVVRRIADAFRGNG